MNDSCEWHCKDCGSDKYTFFMLDHDLWKQIAPEDSKIFLCFDCAEKRLGREIKFNEFIKYTQEEMILGLKVILRENLLQKLL